ncbi:hypothetical protein [Candidatus Hakubella thermalkaliphila]|uniref:hypothetical protein n=1 Tax=Candidatus Hakubella thermalkaliphila TaxID=2754717 RepID=UPI0015930174|nr:hypothetical protein [Candidatus Hakubella thermalkaliphila]
MNGKVKIALKASYKNFDSTSSATLVPKTNLRHRYNPISNTNKANIGTKRPSISVLAGYS